MTRLPDWEDRLHEFLNENAAREFSYGEWDCALFGANAVLALTGVDFAKNFRGRYQSAAGAVRALAEHGAGDLTSTFSAALGDACNPALAGRGDMVLHDGSIGVCMAGFAWFAGEEDGTPGLVAVKRPVEGWSMAWKV